MCELDWRFSLWWDSVLYFNAKYLMGGPIDVMHETLCVSVSSLSVFQSVTVVMWKPHIYPFLVCVPQCAPNTNHVDWMKRTKCDTFQDGTGKRNIVVSLFLQISAPLFYNEGFIMRYDCCKKQLLPALSQWTHWNLQKQAFCRLRLCLHCPG